jgi:hypothetical protein
VSVAFDHLMVMVADEAAAAQDFSQAGFTITPRSELPGMANRLICFPSSAAHAACFIELLSVERPEEVPPRIRSFVGSMLGPVAIVLAVPDLGALQRQLAEKEANVFGPVEIRRQWTLPTGERLDVALDILIGEDNFLPFKWAAVRHYTVQHYQRAAFVLHANGFTRLRAIAISVDDPRIVAERMEALFGCAYRWYGESVIVALGNAQLLMLANGARSLPTTREGAPIVGVVLQGDVDEIDIDHVTYNLALQTQIENSLGVEISHLKLFAVENSPRSPDRSDTA